MTRRCWVLYMVTESYSKNINNIIYMHIKKVNKGFSSIIAWWTMLLKTPLRHRIICVVCSLTCCSRILPMPLNSWKSEGYGFNFHHIIARWTMLLEIPSRHRIIRLVCSLVLCLMCRSRTVCSSEDITIADEGLPNLILRLWAEWNLHRATPAGTRHLAFVTSLKYWVLPFLSFLHGKTKYYNEIIFVKRGFNELC